MKKIFFLLTAILGIAFVAVAFEKVIDIKHTKANNFVSQQVWYPINGPNESPSSLEIQGSPQSSAPNSPNCNLDNTGLPCSVHLEFPNNDAPNSVSSGTTVQDLINTYGASIVLDSENNPEFTRKETE